MQKIWLHLPAMLCKDFNLNKQLLRALEQNGYHTPTTIQQRAFSVIMSGADVCGIAQTGTGKTIAYLLPLLNQWKFSKEKNPQVLVVVPTRELVTQVVDEVKKLGAFLSINVVGVYGGVNINTQGLAFRDGCDILIATPGRLFDLAMAGAFKTKSIKKLVIDEVDEMLNLGFRAQLKNILDMLPQRRQNLLFSATLIPEVEDLIKEYFNDPIKIEAAPAGTPVENILQTAFAVPNFYTKINLLKLLLQEDDTMTKILVFTGSKKLADQVYEEMEPVFENSIGVIHSNKEQNHRFNTVKSFKEGTYKIVIATDIVARGIDVSEVSHVINFDLPAVPENYIHRIGRTGRADKKGVAISFVTEKDAFYQHNIEQLMNLQITGKDLPADLVIESKLTDDELPKASEKEIEIKLPKKDERGPAFHSKSAKNSKLNKRVSHKDLMRKKYGKPIKRAGKK